MASRLTGRLQGFGTTIFAEMTALAVATGSVNLGQGFPDTDGPPEVLEAAVAAIREGRNQYPPAMGVPELRAAVAAHQGRFYGIEVDPDAEVLVTAGATEAIAAAVLALCEPGDEVVAFEPYYDSYAACIAMAGGVRRPVTLRPPSFLPDTDEIRAAVGPRTRLMLLNTPHNPTGAVLEPDLLEEIAAIAVEHDLVVVSDEVYEHLTFGLPHVPLATMPGRWERPVPVGSGGKTFAVTGWKVGWVTGPAALVDAVTAAKQFLTFVASGPLQPAVALGLGLPDAYFEGVAASHRGKRDRLCRGLREAGFAVYEPSGTCFVTADIRPLGEEDGMAFCRALPERCGVVAVPNVVFYDDLDAGRPLVRFAFCKRDEVLDEAVERLRTLAA